MSNFYIAGKFRDRKKIQKLIKSLEVLNHTVKFDWTGHKSVKQDTKAKKQTVALMDLQAVKNADSLIMLWSRPDNYQCSIVEFGVGIGANKQIYIIGKYGYNCVFSYLPTVKKFLSVEKLLSFLQKVALLQSKR